jgi:hypothetical protein
MGSGKYDHKTGEELLAARRIDVRLEEGPRTFIERDGLLSLERP